LEIEDRITLPSTQNAGKMNKFIAFCPISNLLATSEKDQKVKLWRINLNINGKIEFTDNLTTASRRNNQQRILNESRRNLDSVLNLPTKNIQSAGYKNNETRFFKLVSVNGKEFDGGRYELPAKTKSGKAQTRGPKDKASTAFSEICKKNKKKGECSYKFSIQETTRGSNKKVYHYEGKRVKLAKPIVLELKDKKTGEVRKIVKKYKNLIVAI
jgi:hypothetical protein